VNDKPERNLSDYDQPFEVIHTILRDGNSKEIAKRLGKSQIAVDLWGGNPEDNRHPMPICMVVPFTLHSENNLLMEWFAHQVGGVFVKIPDGHGMIAPMAAEMGKLAKEFSDVLQQFSRSIADGKVSEKEKKAIIKQTADLVRQAVQFQRLFK
jgi:hypothetical protein